MHTKQAFLIFPDQCLHFAFFLTLFTSPEHLCCATLCSYPRTCSVEPVTPVIPLPVQELPNVLELHGAISALAERQHAQGVLEVVVEGGSGEMFHVVLQKLNKVIAEEISGVVAGGLQGQDIQSQAARGDFG